MQSGNIQINQSGLKRVCVSLDYKIIDNALSEEKFSSLENEILSSTQPWYYSYNVADANNEEDDMYFIHNYYFGLSDKPLMDSDGNPLPPEKSEWYDDIVPVLDLFTDMKTLLRAKANLYGRTKELVHHDNHTDTNFSHKGAILYINSNNGFTVLEDGTEIKSVRNRLLLFDPSKPHHSTSCTDDKRRVNINFNYI